PSVLRVPFVDLTAGGAMQRNGNARKAVQQDPLGLEPGRNRRARAWTLNKNISHSELPWSSDQARSHAEACMAATVTRYRRERTQVSRTRAQRGEVDQNDRHGVIRRYAAKGVQRNFRSSG